jgi:hypothetical protein
MAETKVLIIKEWTVEERMFLHGCLRLALQEVDKLPAAIVNLADKQDARSLLEDLCGRVASNVQIITIK